MDSRKELFSCKEALFFRNEFREARAAALKDAEGYQQILCRLTALAMSCWLDQSKRQKHQEP